MAIPHAQRLGLFFQVSKSKWWMVIKSSCDSEGTRFFWTDVQDYSWDDDDDDDNPQQMFDRQNITEAPSGQRNVEVQKMPPVR